MKLDLLEYNYFLGGCVVFFFVMGMKLNNRFY